MWRGGTDCDELAADSSVCVWLLYRYASVGRGVWGRCVAMYGVLRQLAGSKCGGHAAKKRRIRISSRGDSVFCDDGAVTKRGEEPRVRRCTRGAAALGSFCASHCGSRGQLRLTAHALIKHCLWGLWLGGA